MPGPFSAPPPSQGKGPGNEVGKRSGYVDCQQVGSIDRNLFFLQTKATHFETMMATVDEVKSDKTKVPEEFIFRSVLLDRFSAELDE